MAGYTRVDTSNNIADGNVISAADLDNEFDGVQSAFNASTGHTHGGAVGEGAPITKLGPTNDVTINTSLMAPKTTNTVDLGSSSLRYKDLWLAGNAAITGTLGITGATTLSAALTYGGVTLSNAVTGTGNMVLSASPTLTGTLSGANASLSGTLAVTGVATLTAQPILSSLTASRAVFTDGSKGLVSNAITGTGNVVMSASPTLTGTITAEALTTSSTVTLNGGTANGVAYLNGSKVLTTGSALTFDGTRLGVNIASPTLTLEVGGGAATGYMHSGVGVLSIGSKTNFPVGFDVNNAEQMRLTSTGLGIGTSSPTEALTITNDNTYKLSLKRTADGSYAAFGATGNSLLIYNNGTERMRLDSSGNLGLGVTPSAWRSGHSVIQLGGGTGLSLASGTGSGYGLFQNAYLDAVGPKYTNNGFASSYYQFNGAHQWFTAPSGTAGNAISFTQAMTLDASGKLLVGTTTAEDFRLAVRGSGMGGILATAPSGYNGIAHLFGINGVSNGYQINCTSGNAISHVWSIGSGAEAARIDSSGNLLVGASAAHNFGIPSIQAGGSNANAIISVRRNTTSSADQVLFYNPNGNVGGISTSGSLTSYNVTSDQRLKENIQDADSASSLIDSLQVRKFDWKTDQTHQRYGFIAQELVTVAPEAVYQPEDTDKMMAVDYSKLVPMLVKEIQSLRQRLAAAGI